MIPAGVECLLLGYNLLSNYRSDLLTLVKVLVSISGNTTLVDNDV